MGDPLRLSLLFHALALSLAHVPLCPCACCFSSASPQLLSRLLFPPPLSLSRLYCLFLLVACPLLLLPLPQEPAMITCVPALSPSSLPHSSSIFPLNRFPTNTLPLPLSSAAPLLLAMAHQALPDRSPPRNSAPSPDDSTAASAFDRGLGLLNAAEAEPRPIDNGFIWRSKTPSPPLSPSSASCLKASSSSSFSSTTTTTTSRSHSDEGSSPTRRTSDKNRQSPPPPPPSQYHPSSLPHQHRIPSPATPHSLVPPPSSSSSTFSTFSSSSSSSSALVSRTPKRIVYKLVQVDPSKERKRLKLPEAATKVLNAWFVENNNNPYPDDDEKKKLMDATGLTRTQVNNWFSYARRRASKNKPPV